MRRRGARRPGAAADAGRATGLAGPGAAAPPSCGGRHHPQRELLRRDAAEAHQRKSYSHTKNYIHNR